MLSNWGFKPCPTLRLVTQVTVRATPWWSGLGPQLNEPSHLKVRLGSHVTLVHFEDVNILIEVTWDDRPWAYYLFSLRLIVGLITSQSKETIHVVSLCFQHKRYYRMCLSFSPKVLTSNVFCKFPLSTITPFLGIQFGSNLEVPITTPNKRLQMHQQILLDQTLQFKSLLFKQDMIREFMHWKSEFST